MSNDKANQNRRSMEPLIQLIKTILKYKVISLILLLIAMVAVFSFWSASVGNKFFDITTLKNTMNSLVLPAFLTIGTGCLLLSGNLDLSASSIGAFGGVVLALSVKVLESPWWVGIILAMLSCAVFGLLNGALINVFRFPAFIATLAMASVARGVMFFVSAWGGGGSSNNVTFNDASMKYLGRGEPIPGVQVGVIILVVAFIVYGIVVSKTRFGMKAVLVGGNPRAARLAGINSKPIIFALFINSSVLAGVAGVFTAARVNQGSLSALQLNQFTGLTAALIGGISFGGGAGGMGGAFVGLLILSTFQIGMSTIGVNPFWVQVFTGLLLLIALSVDFISQERQARAALKAV